MHWQSFRLHCKFAQCMRATQLITKTVFGVFTVTSRRILWEKIKSKLRAFDHRIFFWKKILWAEISCSVLKLKINEGSLKIYNFEVIILMHVKMCPSGKINLTSTTDRFWTFNTKKIFSQYRPFISCQNINVPHCALEHYSCLCYYFPSEAVCRNAFYRNNTLRGKTMHMFKWDVRLFPRGPVADIFSSLF